MKKRHGQRERGNLNMWRLNVPNVEMPFTSLGLILGFIGAALLDFDVKMWTFELTREQMPDGFR